MTTRDELVLAALSPARGATFTPVQVQKLFFLIDMKLAPRVGGPHFKFTPYHYGPYDASVYRALEGLEKDGLAIVANNDDASFRMRTFGLTPVGQQRGEEILSRLRREDQKAAEGIEALCAFVRKHSFGELVAAVYKAYPEMRENSVFRG